MPVKASGTSEYAKWMSYARNNGITPEEADLVWANRDKINEQGLAAAETQETPAVNPYDLAQNSNYSNVVTRSDTLADGTKMSYQTGYNNETGARTFSLNNGQDGVSITKDENGFNVDYYSMMSGAMGMSDVTTVEEALQRIAQIMLQFLQSSLKNVLSQDISELFSGESDKADFLDLIGTLATGNAKNEQELNLAYSGEAKGPGINLGINGQSLGTQGQSFAIGSMEFRWNGNEYTHPAPNNAKEAREYKEYLGNVMNSDGYNGLSAEQKSAVQDAYSDYGKKYNQLTADQER